MKRLTLIAAGASAAALLGAAGYGLYVAGLQRGMSSTPAAPVAATAASQAGTGTEPVPQSIAQGEAATRRHIGAGIKAGDVDPATGKKVLYYHDPMVPGNKFDKPAKSPFMDMMLVPVYADSDGDGSRVTVSPRIQQNLGVRTAAVTEGSLSPQIAAVGSIGWNERLQVIVPARAGGFVEKLHVRAALDRVAAGQPLAVLFVPEWVAPQEEFLALRRMQGGDLAPLIDGARQRLLQAGMSDAQLALVERSGRAQARWTVSAPIGGVVSELSVREGMTVAAGAPLFRLNGTVSIWAHAEVPESQAALLRPGAKVQATTPALPGTRLTGTVQAVLPEVSAMTRTLKARIELPNPGGRLVPGMFVHAQFMDERAGKMLLVPTEAVIQTGRRTVVMLAEDGGRFRPAEISIGIESGGQTEVKSGLQAGQRVVVSSQFLIDSEASLKGVEARLNNEPAPTAASTAPRHSGEGRIESIDRDAVTLSHGPIPSMGMGAMTMSFKLPPQRALPRGLTVGDRVDFEFFVDPNDGPKITHMTLLPPVAAVSAPAAGASR
jgi:Cu(I)/Ag(I) efflux system membrane fusion protein